MMVIILPISLFDNKGGKKPAIYGPLKIWTVVMEKDGVVGKSAAKCARCIDDCLRC